MGIAVDIAIACMFLAALVFGLIKGFAKQFSKFTTVIGTLVCTVIVTGILIQHAMYAEVVYNSVKSVGTWFSGIPGADTTVRTYGELTSVIDSGAFRLFANSADTIWEVMKAYYIFTVGEYIAYLVMQVVVFLILFLIFYTFISNVFKAIGFLLCKLSESFTAIDKILGGVWGVLLVYIFVVCFVLTGTEIVLGLYFPDTSVSFLEFVGQSALLSFGHNTNFVGAILANLFGYVLPPLA